MNMKKHLYIAPQVKFLHLEPQLIASTTVGVGDPDQKPDTDSKAFTGGIEFDDDEDSGSGSSPWE